MKFNSLTVAIALFFSTNLFAQNQFAEKIPVYGIIKPASITTLLAVNHGMVSAISYDLGDHVQIGSSLMNVIEKETSRGYRSTINGQVAKIHVTPGAAVTPGMPLITVINPKLKKIELALSPQEASQLQLGSVVYYRNSDKLFGTVKKISPLVDPDTGAVTSYVSPKSEVEQLVGDVVPLEVVLRELKNCKVVKIAEIDNYLKEYLVAATTGDSACLHLKQ